MKTFALSVAIYRNNAWILIVNKINNETVFSFSRLVSLEEGLEIAKKYNIILKCDDIVFFGMLFKMVK